MKKVNLFLLLIFLIGCKKIEEKNTKDYTLLFEKSNGLETDSYEDVIAFYKNLAKDYNQISLFEIGKTDIGKPIHLAVFNPQGKTNLKDIKNSNKNRILINNGIHPGESDGIDASMLLFRNLVQNDSLQKLYKNCLIGNIVVYNVGGALNRNSHTRVNQNGPKSYGFRGNARNYDLNRDFVKLDTENAKTFTKIFHIIEPEIFIDNHVSNGADYQYTVTHLFTQHNKLGGSLGQFLENEMRPQIEESLAKKEIIITPYVNVWGTTPKSGFSQFFDSPRYSTGYTSLFNTLGFMIETHMLKPYKIRVEQTYDLMLSTLEFAEKNSENIKLLYSNATQEILSKETYPIAFKPDIKNPTTLQFKGYEGTYINSKVTNGKRLFYDRTKPYTEPINYYNNFTITKEIKIPKAYILQQGWHDIIDRLKLNNIEFTQFKNDTTLMAEVNHIKDFKTTNSPFEGHYIHYDSEVTKTMKQITFKKGDLYIPTNQKGVRYLLETLETAAADSFFNWNFFDTILQQKESYSAYVFEEIAEEFLKENPDIKKTYVEKLKTDKVFADNPNEQLNYIYKRTQHFEKAYRRLPVFRVLK